MSADNVARQGPLVYYRTLLTNCKKAHMVSLNPKELPKDATGIKDKQYRLFCSQNDAVFFFRPTSTSNFYNAIATVSSKNITKSLKEAPLLLPNTSMNNIPCSVKTIAIEKFPSIISNITLKPELSTRTMSAVKDASYKLPLYLDDFKGSNISIISRDNNDQISYLNYQQHRVEYPTSVDGFDIDDIFPTTYGVLGAKDNKGLIFLICVENPDFKNQKIIMNCQKVASFDINFFKIVWVDDFYQKCSSILIVGKNTDPALTTPEHKFIVFDYMKQAFEMKGSIAAREKQLRMHSAGQQHHPHRSWMESTIE